METTLNDVFVKLKEIKALLEKMSEHLPDVKEMKIEVKPEPKFKPEAAECPYFENREIEQRFKAIRIERAGLTVRVYNILRTHGCGTLYDVVVNLNSILALRGVGEVVVMTILGALKSNGFNLFYLPFYENFFGCRRLINRFYSTTI